MARYRKVHVCVWADAKFRALSSPNPNGQSLWLYLLTGPHTTQIPGLFTGGEAGLAEALGWPLEGFRKAFREVFSQGMVEADWKAVSSGCRTRRSIIHQNRQMLPCLGCVRLTKSPIVR